MAYPQGGASTGAGRRKFAGISKELDVFVLMLASIGSIRLPGPCISAQGKLTADGKGAKGYIN